MAARFRIATPLKLTMDARQSELRGWVQVLAMGLSVLAGGGCGGMSGNGPQGSPSAGGGGASGGSTAEIAGAATAGAAGLPSTCAGKAPATVAATGLVELPIQFVVNQAPMTIGAPAPGRTGLEYKLSALELFLAEPTLLDASGHESKAQIVGADAKPLPYGIQLVSADDPATETLRLSLPQGNYTALTFGVGVPAGCNAVSTTDAVYPLNPDGEMFWTWGSQFLFIRIEGASRMPPATDFTTFYHHVGYDPAYARLTVPGAISVAASGGGPTLVLDVDLLLAGGENTTSGVPSGSRGIPDGWVVDNLETRQVFSLR
jgi:hypothetical protein